MTDDEHHRESNSDFASEDARTEAFIRLLAENERLLSAYVMTMVPNPSDADDIL